jgi:hypothetical protein
MRRQAEEMAAGRSECEHLANELTTLTARLDAQLLLTDYRAQLGVASVWPAGLSIPHNT